MAGSAHGRGADQVSLRLPEGMRERIKRAADDNGRSMNAEIVATLLEAYPTEKSFGDLVDEIRGMLEDHTVDFNLRNLSHFHGALVELVDILDRQRDLSNADEDKDPRG